MKKLKCFAISFLFVAPLSASQGEFSSENENWIEPLCTSIGELSVPITASSYQHPINSQPDNLGLAIKSFEFSKRVKEIEDGEAELLKLAEEARVEAQKITDKYQQKQETSLQAALEKRVKDLEDESVRLRQDIEEEKNKNSKDSCTVS